MVRKSKKMRLGLKGIISFAIAIVIIASIFMPVIVNKSEAIGGLVKTEGSVSGMNYISGLFADVKGDNFESLGSSTEDRLLYSVMVGAKGEEGGFLITLSMILALLVLIVAIASAGLCILGVFVKGEFAHYVKQSFLALLLLGVLTLLLLFILTGQMSSSNFLASTTFTVGVGAYIMAIACIGGGLFSFLYRGK